METITATEGHPFWVADQGERVPAGELQRGDWLRTGSGSWVQVQSIKIRTEAQRVHNLTVDDLHIYHVLAGATPVLVHNCGPGVATEDDAMLAFNRAEELQASRNDYYMVDVMEAAAGGSL